MLNQKKQTALAALLSHPTRAAAARSCGLSEKTLQRYQKDPEFAAALQQARDGAMQQAAESIGACYPRAVEALHQMLCDEKQQGSVRVSAARALLEYGLKYTEQLGTQQNIGVVFVNDIPGQGE